MALTGNLLSIPPLHLSISAVDSLLPTYPKLCTAVAEYDRKWLDLESHAILSL